MHESPFAYRLKADLMIPPMCKVPMEWVVHIDSKGRQKSKMKQVMKPVEHEGMLKCVCYVRGGHGT